MGMRYVILCLFAFSVSQWMDDGGTHGVLFEMNLQVSDAACEYSVSTDSNTKQDLMSSTVSTDCEVSADIPEHCMFDYNTLHGIKCEHEQPEEVRTDNAYGRQGDAIQGHVGLCLPSVKSEENRQELSDDRNVLPPNSMCNANETIPLKPEQNEDPDEYDTNNEAPRHWVVCPDGVLKEVKTEHTSGASDVLSVGDCSRNVGHKQRTQPVSYNNNIQTNVEVSTHSTCDVSSTQFMGRGNGPKAHRRTCKIVKYFTCGTCGKQFVYLCRLKLHEKSHTGVKHFACDTCGKPFARLGDVKMHERIHTGSDVIHVGNHSLDRNISNSMKRNMKVLNLSHVIHTCVRVCMVATVRLCVGPICTGGCIS